VTGVRKNFIYEISRKAELLIRTDGGMDGRSYGKIDGRDLASNLFSQYCERT